MTILLPALRVPGKHWVKNTGVPENIFWSDKSA